MSVTVTVSDVTPPSLTGRPTKKLWTRRDRQLIKKLQNAIRTVRNMDNRMEVRSTSKGFDGRFFAGQSGSTIDRALTSLANACGSALSARV